MTNAFRISGPDALLIDGDNIAAVHAPTILHHAGCPGIRRVYGNMTMRKDWSETTGFRLLHSGTGKNSSDILMTIDAMELALAGGVRRLTLASSDSDFSHLALYLREKGVHVEGIGDKKTPQSLREACATFRELPVVAPPAPAPPIDPLVEKVIELIRSEGVNGQMQIGKLGGRMASQHGVLRDTLPTSGWSSWLARHPAVFACDPKGPQAMVRLKAMAPVSPARCPSPISP